MTTPFDQFPTATGEAPSEVMGTDSTEFGAFPDAQTEMQGDQPQGNPGTRVENPGLESFGAGVVDSSMIGPGMWAGARLGQPGGPWGMAGGAVAGAVAGALAGPEIRKMTGLRTPDEMAPDQRPLGKAMYSFGGGAVVAATPFGLARSGLMLAEVGVGKFFNNIVRQASKTPLTVATIEATGVASSATGAGIAETLAPGSALAAFVGEVTGGIVNPVGRAVTTWNFGVGVFERAMNKYGRNAQEVAFGKQMVAGIKKFGGDPEAVIKVLEAGNPYGLTAAQLTGDDFLIATERALAKSSDPFARSVLEKGKTTRDAMTAQINVLRATGDPQFLADIAELRVARFSTMVDSMIEVGKAKAKDVVAQGVRKGMTDADLPEISRKARAALDTVDELASAHSSELFGKVKLNIPTEMTELRKTVDDILRKSADELKSDKIPGYITKALATAEKNAEPKFSYDPDTFVVGESAAGNLLTDSRSMLDYRSQLLAATRVVGGSDVDKGIAKRLQAAVMADLDKSFKEGLDDSYDNARAFHRAYKESFERSFTGEVMASGKRGERVDPGVLINRAFAVGGEAANIKLKALEDATRLLSRRGLGEDGAVELMLDAQEKAYRILTTSSMKDGRINPETMVETIRKNPMLFNRPPFTEVRDDLLKAIKSEGDLSKIEDFVARRNNDIGKKSAMARITGSDPVSYASKILISTNQQEDQLIKMFNLAKKGGTNRQGVTTITSEQGVSSARASVLNAAFNRSMTGGAFDLEKFRGLLFTPNVAGEKSIIKVMLEQKVIEPEHATNMSSMFNTLDMLKKAERQGTAIDVEKGAGEVGLILMAKIGASKLVGVLQRATGQSGSSIIVHGAVAKAAEHVVSKIPAAKAKDLGVLLLNDPKMLATVMRKETDPSKRMLQIRTFHSWAIQAGLTAGRETLIPEYDDEPQMFSQ